jgi:hypothetical protein
LSFPTKSAGASFCDRRGGSNIGRDPGAFEFGIATKDLPIEGEDEEVPYTTPLTPSDVTFRDLTRMPKNDAPNRPKIADARALIDERLSDGGWHPSMLDELIEAGFTKSTVYRAAEPVVKVRERSGEGAWWWAAHGTPKSSFVELDGENGNKVARARSKSPRGNNTPKSPSIAAVGRSSQLPAELDESESGPTLFPTSHGLRAGAREGVAAPESVIGAAQPGNAITEGEGLG